MTILDAKSLRDIPYEEAQAIASAHPRSPLYLILENVYDTYNVGGLFRLADSLSVAGMYLCGAMETPPNPRIHKASIGTYKVVPWHYAETVQQAILDIQKGLNQGETLCTVAVEQWQGSQDYTTIPYQGPVALIVGNETTGVTEGTLALCNHIAEIPMRGINKSLNVIVSAAIVSYEVMRQLGQNPSL